MSFSEEKKRKLREKNFEESKLDPFHSKYGLFSFAGTLAVNLPSYDSYASPRRDSDGNVKLSPRNFLVSPSKKGKASDAYFSVPGFLAVGDKYKDPSKSTVNNREKAAKMKAVHDSPFKLPGPFELKAQYEYIPTEKITQKRYKSTFPRNFYTSPGKKGVANCTPGVTFSDYDHVPDPFSTIKHRTNESHSPCFKPVGTTSNLFDKNVYSLDGIRLNKKIIKTQVQKPIDVPFRPPNMSKTNILDALFSKFEYIPSVPGSSPKTTKFQSESNVPWRPTIKESTTPTPGIAFIKKNLKQEYKLNF